MRVKAKCLKEAFRKDDFRILNWSPYEKKDLVLSKYFTFSTKGNDTWADVGKDYEIDIELISSHPQFGGTYAIKAVPSMMEEDLENLNYDEKFNILRQCTSSDRLATNILEAYPDFIVKILNEGKESIDLNNIKGVGESYLNAYSRILNDKYKYFNIFNKFSEWGIDMRDAKNISLQYGTENGIIKALDSDPYGVLITVCGKAFLNADKLILEKEPKWRETETRCSYLMLDVLEKNEQESGSTRLNGNDLYFYIKNELNYPELLPLIVPTAQNSELIYYDEPTKDLAKMSTYAGECRIADFIETKLANNHVLDIDWKKYTKFDDGSELTEEQQMALKTFCEKDFSLLTGFAGCVDRKTEFFNGVEWKSIADYKEGEFVLQYNTDGTATLVKPYRYINEPCDMMYHFETKYGLDQTLTPDHRCITRTSKGVIKENTMQEIYELQNSDFGYRPKFITSFKYDGNGIDLTDAEIKLMCAVICDGSFAKVSEKAQTYKKCRFHIKKDRKKVRLREIFAEANLEWREIESAAEGYTDFYVEAPRREKEFTSYWYNCSQHQLQIICDNILFWDGNENITPNGKTRKRFSTTIEQTAEFIQFAFTACGYRANLRSRDRRGRIRIVNGKEYIQKSIDYEIDITDRIYTGFSLPTDKGETTKIDIVAPSDGRKYCFTVPSNMLVLRRNKKIFITGNCGKTKTLEAILNLCDDNGLTYSLFALQGAAALRITEATHRPASTIHRPFYREQTFNSDLYIIDETSMCDVEVINMFISLIDNPNGKVIFVGDPSQIQSVGCGNVFYDIIESNRVPNTMLKTVFRYGDNGILFTATNTREGKDFFDDPIVKHTGNKYSVKNNYEFIETENIFDEVIKKYEFYLNNGVKPKDILCLSPYNVQSEGTYVLNNTIQNIVNPPKANQIALERKIGSTKIYFRVGDKVINKKNDYKVLPLESFEMIEESGGVLTSEDVPQTTIFNGQVGYIRELNEKYCIIQFDEEMVVFEKMKMANDVLLGYCITDHASQGQECPNVINIVSPSHARMHTRNLLYVAGTRAKKYHTDIGSIQSFKNGIAVDGNKLRDTFLKELLKEQQGLDN